MNKTPVYIHSVAAVSALGAGCANVFSEAADPEHSLVMSDAYSTRAVAESVGAHLPLGLVREALPEIDIAEENTRNNQLLRAAILPLQSEIENLKETYRSSRIGIVLGTSTSGISDGETAIEWSLGHGQLPNGYQYSSQEPFAPARYLARSLGVNGPVWTVSSACTSGGKALASAARMLRLGVCDAVIAGGVDSLCRMTVAGFASLGVASGQRCQPFSRQRAGINIGEAAAIFVMTREQADVMLAGVGETSDAHHISAPDPDGAGAEAAMRLALEDASMTTAQVDYLNFHGTATRQNDKMEADAACRIFAPGYKIDSAQHPGLELACGSTKSLTGHTLGAAGALEAAICWYTIMRDDGRLPEHCWRGDSDPDLPAMPGLSAHRVEGRARVAMSNSFAFGGNNLSLVLARNG